jgi:nucleotide-binding universal stress UspA family protein
MNNVTLCTIDFSDASKNVLNCAVRLSRQLNSHITVLYAYRFLTGQEGEPLEIKKKIEASAKQKFSALEKDILQDSGISYDFVIEVGFVSNRVAEYAKNNDVNYLVMGNKMNATSKESFDELVEKIHLPLVIVP